MPDEGRSPKPTELRSPNPPNPPSPREHTRPHIGPDIRRSPEPSSQGPSPLDRLLEMLKMAVRLVGGYGDSEIEKDCSQSEISRATYLGCVIVMLPFVTGGIAAAATNSLAGDGFSFLRCCACFAVAAFMTFTDCAVLQSRMFQRGVKELRDGGIYIKLPSDADRATRRIVGFRIAQSIGFGALIATAVGLAMNGEAINARIDEDYLARNHAIVEQAGADYNAELAHAQAAYDSQHGLVDRLTNPQARVTGRANLPTSERRVVQEKQRLDQDRAALDQLIAARPERLHRAIEASPLRIEKSNSLVSRVRALFEEFWERPISSIPALLIDGLIIGLDSTVLCLGSIGIRGRYPARYARRRLEELTEEARATAELGREPETPADDPATPSAPSIVPDRANAEEATEGTTPETSSPKPPLHEPPASVNGAAPRRRGRPRKNPAAQSLKEAGHG